MRPKPLLLPLLVVGAMAACSGGDDDAASPTTSPAGGCPVDGTVVAEAVGHDIAVERGPRGSRTCTYVGVGEVDEVSLAGARVEVTARSLDDRPFAAVLADVERRSGPTVALPDDLVDGADRGWIVSAGRAVQLGAARDDLLVIVAVSDPILDRVAAEEAAAAIAEAALED